MIILPDRNIFQNERKLNGFPISYQLKPVQTFNLIMMIRKMSRILLVFKQLQNFNINSKNIVNFKAPKKAAKSLQRKVQKICNPVRNTTCNPGRKQSATKAAKNLQSQNQQKPPPAIPSCNLSCKNNVLGGHPVRLSASHNSI